MISVHVFLPIATSTSLYEILAMSGILPADKIICISTCVTGLQIKLSLDVTNQNN